MAATDCCSVMWIWHDETGITATALFERAGPVDNDEDAGVESEAVS